MYFMAAHLPELRHLPRKEAEKIYRAALRVGSFRLYVHRAFRVFALMMIAGICLFFSTTIDGLNGLHCLMIVLSGWSVWMGLRLLQLNTIERLLVQSYLEDKP